MEADKVVKAIRKNREWNFEKWLSDNYPDFYVKSKKEYLDWILETE